MVVEVILTTLVLVAATSVVEVAVTVVVVVASTSMVDVLAVEMVVELSVERVVTPWTSVVVVACRVDVTMLEIVVVELTVWQGGCVSMQEHAVLMKASASETKEEKIDSRGRPGSLDDEL